MIPFLADATAADPGSNPMALVMQIGVFALIIGVFYFMLIRPENKRKKEATKMRKDLIVGDEVTTIGGIVGKVVSIKDDTITVETGADKSRIKVMRWAISTKGTQISN